MAECLKNKGYEVTVVTGFPYYPQWEIREEYRKRPRFVDEMLNGIRVLRYRQYVPQTPTFLKRIIHLTDFTIGSFINLRKIDKADVVISIVPFTTTILLGWLHKRQKKAKLWAHIQDFEFDAALQSGVSKSKENRFKRVVFGFFFWIEKYLFSKTDAVSTISYAMLKKLREKTSVKTIYFPNWIDLANVKPDDYAAHPYLKSDKFKILYSGNIGEKQDWKLFVDLATRLQIFDNIDIIVVGDGSSANWLKNKLKSCPNVSIYAPIPYSDLSNLLCSADLHILLQKIEVVDSVMPSKLLGMMGSGKPSIIKGNKRSEVREIVMKSEGGLYLDTNNLNELVEAIKKLMENREIAKNMGEKGRKFVEENFEIKKILSDFESNLESLIS